MNLRAPFEAEAVHAVLQITSTVLPAPPGLNSSVSGTTSRLGITGSASRTTVTVCESAPMVTVSVLLFPAGASVTVKVPFPLPDLLSTASPASGVTFQVPLDSTVTLFLAASAASKVRLRGETLRTGSGSPPSLLLQLTDSSARHPARPSRRKTTGRMIEALKFINTDLK